MMANLWSSNAPADFWLCEPGVRPEHWEMAVRRALPVLGLPAVPDSMDALLALTLGEAQFGPERWQLSRARRLYYTLKPVLPRALIRYLRRSVSSGMQVGFPLGWPAEPRYARFQWQVMRELLVWTAQASCSFRYFWPEGRRFAFVLTHDIETKEGQSFVRAVADLDESFGFRSSFNFVPERYRLDYTLIDELRERGFEIGVHGLKHDGKLFHSRSGFMARARRINRYLKEFGAVGFRAPLTHRNPEWMQALDVDYDLSFFDTDPFEPMPGGTMSLWPFVIGRFVELPYTLAQDHTLTAVLGETTPRVWVEKLDLIAEYRGMALVNTHPDYLLDDTTWKMYAGLLREVRDRGQYWHALPRQVADWWRTRASAAEEGLPPGVVLGRARLEPGGLVVEPELASQPLPGTLPVENVLVGW
jgi:peptidoglycan/xylan/chitin deacetylase (PgdA/CDA1 family)